MPDSDNFEPYEINEQDIDATINFLKSHDPENATADRAISFLEFVQSTIHQIGHADPDKLTQLYDDFQSRSNN